MPTADAVVLDTHAWLWWQSGAKGLSRAARRALDQATVVVVPAVCLWEVAQLSALGRIRTDRDTLEWMRQALAQDRVELAPLSPEIAVISADLGREGFPGDPSDRLVYGTARTLDAPLLSADERMRSFERGLPRRQPRHIVW
jgi:PIN domain nuclease of toxin-antitoxin system